MLDLLDNINPDVEVLERSFKLSAISNRMLSQVLENNNNKSKDYWARCIVAVAGKSDKEAFSNLFTHFAPRIKSFLMKGGADAIIAEECVQETMVAVWNKAYLFDPTRAAASTWIFTIARNKRIDTARRNNRPEPDVLPWGNETEPDASEIISIQEETTLLAQAVKELPEKQRIIVERAFYNDLSHQEIANETGLPLGTIKSRIRLALQRLRHNMK
ncbi:sigma-70 family RNA polymerase sigma factor [Amylibacter sp.]|nr:sigma-70 family RNA polymerase sigma factor [Amylibacter sp.]